jgi:hypothetical protein
MWSRSELWRLDSPVSFEATTDGIHHFMTNRLFLTSRPWNRDTDQCDQGPATSEPYSGEPEMFGISFTDTFRREFYSPRQPPR